MKKISIFVCESEPKLKTHNWKAAAEQALIGFCGSSRGLTIATLIRLHKNQNMTFDLLETLTPLRTRQIQLTLLMLAYLKKSEHK